MRDTKNTLKAATRGKSIVLSGGVLVNILDLERQAKQAHWNLRGANFIALHELFDKLADGARALADEVAERMAALGGEVDGTSSSIASRSTLEPYPSGANSEEAHVAHVAKVVADCSALARAAVEDADKWGDPATADVMTEVTRELDKLGWMVEAHLPAAE